MKLIIAKNYEEMTEASLKVVTDLLREKPDCTICMTTGASPRGLAERLAQEENCGLDLSQAVFMNLDEFIAPGDAVFSVKRFMEECLYGRLKHQPREIFRFDGETADQEKEIRRYKGILAEHPRDLQILGLGLNGHVGCNEPGTPFDQEVFVGTLSQSTILKTIDQFQITPEECPRAMFTLGMKEIMEAATVLLQVSGRGKAQALKRLLEGGVTENCPASLLTTHPDFICVADEEAARLLKIT